MRGEKPIQIYLVSCGALRGQFQAVSAERALFAALKFWGLPKETHATVERFEWPWLGARGDRIKMRKEVCR